MKTVIMRSRVRLTMSGFPPIAAFQRMEKRTAWIGNDIPHLRRDRRSSEIHAPDARTEPSHLRIEPFLCYRQSRIQQKR